MFSVSDFKTNLKNGGARSSLFTVEIAGNDFNDFSYMCKSASLPSINRGVISTPYFGKEIKTSGDLTFDVWNTTVINDEDFRIKKTLENWLVNDPTLTRYLYIKPYSKGGSQLQEIVLKEAFPMSISEIPLAWDNSAIQEFTVSWGFSYWDYSKNALNIGKE